MPPLPYVAFFQDSCIFALLLFSEKLYPQSSYFFGAGSCLEQTRFLSISLQISCFFRAKLPPSSCFLKINSSLGQLHFQNSHFFRGRVTFSWHVTLHSIKFFRTATFLTKLLLQKRYLLGQLIFKKSCFLEVAKFSGFLGELLY